MRYLLNFHQFHGDTCAGDSRGLMTLFRSLNIEKLEQLRICRVVRPFAGCRQRRDIHAEGLMVERQRAVHVLDKSRERSGAEDGRLADGRRACLCLTHG